MESNNAVFILEVTHHGGLRDEIHIRHGDDPTVLATSFAAKHDLPTKVIPKLATHIRTNYESSLQSAGVIEGGKREAISPAGTQPQRGSNSTQEHRTPSSNLAGSSSPRNYENNQSPSLSSKNAQPRTLLSPSTSPTVPFTPTNMNTPMDYDDSNSGAKRTAWPTPNAAADHVKDDAHVRYPQSQSLPHSHGMGSGNSSGGRINPYDHHHHDDDHVVDDYDDMDSASDSYHDVDDDGDDDDGNSEGERQAFDRAKGVWMMQQQQHNQQRSADSSIGNSHNNHNNSSNASMNAALSHTHAHAHSSGESDNSSSSSSEGAYNRSAGASRSSLMQDRERSYQGVPGGYKEGRNSYNAASSQVPQGGTYSGGHVSHSGYSGAGIHSGSGSGGSNGSGGMRRQMGLGAGSHSGEGRHSLDDDDDDDDHGDGDDDDDMHGSHNFHSSISNGNASSSPNSRNSHGRRRTRDSSVYSQPDSPTRACMRLYANGAKLQQRHKVMTQRAHEQEAQCLKDMQWKNPKYAESVSRNRRNNSANAANGSAHGNNSNTAMYDECERASKARELRLKQLALQLEKEKDKWSCPRCGYENAYNASACQRVIGSSDPMMDVMKNAWAFAKSTASTSSISSHSHTVHNHGNGAHGNGYVMNRVVHCDCPKPVVPHIPTNVSVVLRKGKSSNPHLVTRRVASTGSAGDSNNGVVEVDVFTSLYNGSERQKASLKKLEAQVRKMEKEYDTGKPALTATTLALADGVRKQRRIAIAQAIAESNAAAHQDSHHTNADGNDDGNDRYGDDAIHGRSDVEEGGDQHQAHDDDDGDGDNAHNGAHGSSTQVNVNGTIIDMSRLSVHDELHLEYVLRTRRLEQLQQQRMRETQSTFMPETGASANGSAMRWSTDSGASAPSFFERLTHSEMIAKRKEDQLKRELKAVPKDPLTHQPLFKPVLSTQHYNLHLLRKREKAQAAANTHVNAGDGDIGVNEGGDSSVDGGVEGGDRSATGTRHSQSHDSHSAHAGVRSRPSTAPAAGAGQYHHHHQHGTGNGSGNDKNKGDGAIDNRIHPSAKTVKIVERVRRKALAELFQVLLWSQHYANMNREGGGGDEGEGAQWGAMDRLSREWRHMQLHPSACDPTLLRPPALAQVVTSALLYTHQQAQVRSKKNRGDDDGNDGDNGDDGEHHTGDDDEDAVEEVDSVMTFDEFVAAVEKVAAINGVPLNTLLTCTGRERTAGASNRGDDEVEASHRPRLWMGTRMIVARMPQREAKVEERLANIGAQYARQRAERESAQRRKEIASATFHPTLFARASYRSAAPAMAHAYGYPS